MAILYGGGIFACRHCYQLAYPSQRKTHDDWAARLTAQHDAFVQVSLAGMSARFNLLGELPDDRV